MRVEDVVNEAYERKKLRCTELPAEAGKLESQDTPCGNLGTMGLQLLPLPVYHLVNAELGIHGQGLQQAKNTVSQSTEKTTCMVFSSCSCPLKCPSGQTEYANVSNY